MDDMGGILRVDVTSPLVGFVLFFLEGVEVWFQTVVALYYVSMRL